jgi:chemotaxis protein MotB
MKQIQVIILILVLTIASCVPARQFQDEKARREQCEKNYNELKASSEKLNIQVEELQANFATLERKAKNLEGDTAMTRNTLRSLQSQYDKINELYELLLLRNKELLEGSEQETRKISTELFLTQEQLQKKEDELRNLELALMSQKENLDKFETMLNKKEQRINELENILKQQDAAVKDLREKVASALLGFENNGLTIEIRNGKVYVSLEESLLFPSGSWSVNAKGRDALIKLSKVLETNTDVNILIEGHTDNVPFRGSGQVKDNWDLSVMRATAIVKILTDNSNINPQRLIAAGRSEYVPVETANTADARQKNRRTEIILTPKLDELFEILEMK